MNGLIQNDGKRSNDSGGNSMAVDDEDVIAHPVVQRGLGQNIHPCKPKLQEHNTKERLCSLKQSYKLKLLHHAPTNFAHYISTNYSTLNTNSKRQMMLLCLVGLWDGMCGNQPCVYIEKFVYKYKHNKYIHNTPLY